MKVIIMRGIPGSGKTTWAGKWMENNPGWVKVSADDFHVVEGVYRFDTKNASAAHIKCLHNFLEWIEFGGMAGVIVDNTNTTAWEIAPYYALAVAYGRHVAIQRMCCSFEVAATRNTHNVPAKTIWNMHQNLMTERLPPHWAEEFVFPEDEQ